MATKRPYRPLSKDQQRKAKRYRKNHKKPYQPQTPTAYSLKKEMFKEAGAEMVFQFRRTHATDLQRLLVNNRLPRELSDFLSPREALELKASLTGLKPGRIALTLPERLTIGWLEANGYTFGGVYPKLTNPGADFFSQYPVGGGRAAFGGGLVGDVFITASASKTSMGIIIGVDGAYYHGQQAVSARDDAQNKMLEALGFKVARILDSEVYNQGVLDNKMNYIVGHK